MIQLQQQQQQQQQRFSPKIFESVMNFQQIC